MSNDQHSVNVQPSSTSRAAGFALALGILSLPGSLLAWDTLPGGGFVWGLPLAVAAVIVGVKARTRRRVGSRSRDHRHRPRRRDDRHDGHLDGRRRRLTLAAAFPDHGVNVPMVRERVPCSPGATPRETETSHPLATEDVMAPNIPRPDSSPRSVFVVTIAAAVLAALGSCSSSPEPKPDEPKPKVTPTAPAPSVDSDPARDRRGLEDRDL